MVMSTLKIGFQFPYTQTLALLVSQAPPIGSDSFHNMASPTNSNLAMYLWFYFSLTFFGYACCTFTVIGYKKYYYILMTVLLSFLMVSFGWYSIYLRNEYKRYHQSDNYKKKELAP